MRVTIRLLGQFEVAVDGDPVAADAWSRRQASSLVKLLSLAPDRRLHREVLIEALWPGVGLDQAGPRLHKAAHYARRAIGGASAVVLRNETVALLPDGDVRLDLDVFRRLGREALRAGTATAATTALGQYGGPLLADDLYEEWTERDREDVRALHVDLLRLAGRWEELLAEEPADEPAHLALIRSSLERGDQRAALRQFERLDQALRRELGTTPSPDAERLRARVTAGAAPAPAARAGEAPTVGVRLMGRRAVGDQVREHLARAEAGRGGALLVTGPAGIGKSALLDLTEALARQRGWRCGRGAASEVEGSWPYAPVVEAFADVARRHPALLDGLDDVYRTEIERALAARDVSWSGEASHQRFLVAVAELMRLAATGHGLLLLIDDLHEADEASLRLLHYLARCTTSEPVLVVAAYRPVTGGPLEQMADSLVRKGTGHRVRLDPLELPAVRRLVADRFPGLAAELVEQTAQVSQGVPFVAIELARSGGTRADAVLPVLPGPVATTFQRVALAGTTFTTDELLALSDVDEDATYRQLEVAYAARLVEPAEAGHRFRHALVREALVEQVPASAAPAQRRAVAEGLARLGGPPGRLAQLYLDAGLASRAVPYALRAIDAAGALGAYRDGLRLIDAVREHAGPDELPRLLTRRGDLLLAIGDPRALAAYQEAVASTSGTEHRRVRAFLARAACYAGDFDLARTALDGLAPDGDAADGPILLAQGNLAFLTGDVEAAWEFASRARDLLRSPDDPWQLMDVISLQGLIAHQRGEWFDRFRMELRRTQGKQRLATVLFDAHLCVAEYLLYGPVPYEEVIGEAEELRRRADHVGALRGVAFATAIIGEAALLMGDLTRAEAELTAAAELHRDIDAPAGEAHSLQRLAEVRLAQGDKPAARALLRRALPLARWSAVAHHLLQRIYGSLVLAAADPPAARAVVDEGEAVLGENTTCVLCSIMFTVPAAIGCAQAGDLEEARHQLALAQAVAPRWPGDAWPAAVLEAEAQVLLASERGEDAAALLARAAARFDDAGQPLDAARCRSDAGQLVVA